LYSARFLSRALKIPLCPAPPPPRAPSHPGDASISDGRKWLLASGQLVGRAAVPAIDARASAPALTYAKPVPVSESPLPNPHLALSSGEVDAQLRASGEGPNLEDVFACRILAASEHTIVPKNARQRTNGP
jgi:hypothetical protein